MLGIAYMHIVDKSYPVDLIQSAKVINADNVGTALQVMKDTALAIIKRNGYGPEHRAHLEILLVIELGSNSLDILDPIGTKTHRYWFCSILPDQFNEQWMRRFE